MLDSLLPFTKPFHNLFKSHQPKEIPDTRSKVVRGGVRELQELVDLTDERSGIMEGIANGETLGYRGRGQPEYGREDDRDLPQYIPSEVNAQAEQGPRSMHIRSVASQAKSNAANGHSPYKVTGMTATRTRRINPEDLCRQQLGQARQRKRTPDDGGIANRTFHPVASDRMYGGGSSTQRADRDASRQPLRQSGAPLRDLQLRHVPKEPYDSYSDYYDEPSDLGKTARDRKQNHPDDSLVDVEPESPNKAQKGGFGGHAKKLSSDTGARPRTSNPRRSTSPIKGPVATTNRRTSVHSISSDEQRRQSSPEAVEPIEQPKTRARTKKVQGTDPKAPPLGHTPGEERQKATDGKQITGAAKGKSRARDDVDFIVPSAGRSQKPGTIKSSNLPKRYAAEVSESWLNVDPLRRLLASRITWDAVNGDLSFMAKGRELFRIPPKAISSESQFCDSTNFPIMWIQINRTGCETFIDQLKDCYGVDIQDFSVSVLFRLKSDVLSGQLVASLADWLKLKARVRVHTMDEPAAIAVITGLTAQNGRDRPRRTAVQDQMIEAAEERHQNQRQAPRRSRNSKGKDAEMLSDESFDNNQNKKATTKRRPKSEVREAGQTELPFRGMQDKPKPKDRPFIDMASGEAAPSARTRSTRVIGKPAQYKDPSDDEVELGKAPEQMVVEPPVTTLARPDNPSGVLFPYPLTGRADINLTEGDKWRVEAGDFLNDTLVEFGLKHVMWEIGQKGAKADVNIDDDVYLFNSFFYQKLSVPSKPFTNSDTVWPAYNSVKKWTKGKEIFKKKYLIIPINENAHWYLAVIINPAGILRASEPEVPDEHAMGSVTQAAAGLSLAPDEDAQDANQASDEIQAEDIQSRITTPGAGDYKDVQADYEAELNDRDVEDGLDLLGTPTTDKPTENTEISSSPDFAAELAADQSFDVLDSIPRDVSSRPVPASTISESRKTRRAGHNSSCIDLSASPEPEPVGKPINSDTLNAYLTQKSRPKDSPDEATERVEVRDNQEKEGLGNSTSSSGKGKAKENLNIWASDDTWIITFDSLGGAHKAVDRVLGKWLQFEAVDKQGKTRDMLSKSYYREARVPNQPNYSDCGLYLIHYVQQLLDRPKEIISFIEIAVPAGSHQGADRIAFNGQMNDVWRESETNQLRQLWTSMIDSLAQDYVKIRKERGQSEPDNQAEDDEDDLVIAASQDVFRTDQAQGQEQGFQDEGERDRGVGPDVGNNGVGMGVDIAQAPGITTEINSSALPPDQPGDIQMEDRVAGSPSLDQANDLREDDAFGIGISPSSQPYDIISGSTDGAKTSVPFGDDDVEDEPSTFDRDPPGAMENPEADQDLLDDPQASFIPDSQPGQSQVTPPHFQTSTSQDEADNGAYAAADTHQLDAEAFSADDADCQPVLSQQASMLMGNRGIQVEQGGQEDELDDTDVEEEEQPEDNGTTGNHDLYRAQLVTLEKENEHAMVAAPLTAEKGKGTAMEALSDEEPSNEIEDVTADHQPVIDVSSMYQATTTATVGTGPPEQLRQIRNAHKLSVANERKAQSAPAVGTSHTLDHPSSGSAPDIPVILTPEEARGMSLRVETKRQASGSRRPFDSLKPYVQQMDRPQSVKPRYSPREAMRQPSPPLHQPFLPEVPAGEPFTTSSSAIDPALILSQDGNDLEEFIAAQDRTKAFVFGVDDEGNPPHRPVQPLVGFPTATTPDPESSASSSIRLYGVDLSSKSTEAEATITIKRTKKRNMFIPPAPINTAPAPLGTDLDSPLSDLPATTDGDRHPQSSSPSIEAVSSDQVDPRYHKRSPIRSAPPQTYSRLHRPPKSSLQQSDLSSSSDSSDGEEQKMHMSKGETVSSRKGKGRRTGGAASELPAQDENDLQGGDEQPIGRSIIGFPSDPASASKSARISLRQLMPHPDEPMSRRSSLKNANNRSLSPSKGSRTTDRSGEIKESTRSAGDNDLFASDTTTGKRKIVRHTSGSGSIRTEDEVSANKRQRTTDDQPDDQPSRHPTEENDTHRTRRPDKQASAPANRKLQPANKRYNSKPSLKPRQTKMELYTSGNSGGAGSSSAPGGRSTVERAAKTVANGQLQVQGRNGSDGRSREEAIEFVDD